MKRLPDVVTTGSRARSISAAVGFIAVKNVKAVEDRVRRLVQRTHDAQAR